jgi:HK97 family phage prohead protease
MEREQRTIKTELRVAAGGDGGTLKGYAASYDCLSGPIPGGRTGVFREKIARGAFDAALRRGDDVVCLQQHSGSLVLGRTSSGTLRLRSDDYGLLMECDLPNTTAAQDLRKLVMRGDIREMSFQFSARQEDQDWDEGTDDEGNRCLIRTVRSCRLFDVSAVVLPAYPQGTSLEARSTNYSVRLASATEQEAEKKIWRAAFDLQMRRDGF